MTATSDKRQATSDKRQATSDKRQATSDKRQATSDKRQATLGFSPNLIAQRKAEVLSALRHIAPELISDDQLKLDALEELLSGKIADKQEHYELSWAGKSDARREIQQSTSHTLHPDSNNPEQAQHMLIEGENLEVLRVLQKSYYGKVKMIYIDPPYNTGNDSFVYPDKFAETRDDYQKRTGEKDEQGLLNKQSLWKANSKESGHYHSAWLSMMYPRLFLARNLLREDGVIFISIDDNEAANLKLLCDEVFGEENHLNTFVWVSNLKGRQISARGAAGTKEYILCYAREQSKTEEFRSSGRRLKNLMPSIYKGFNYEIKNDEYGPYVVKNELYNTNSVFNEETRPNLVYDIYYNPSTRDIKTTAVSIKHLYPDYIKISPKKNNNGLNKYHAYRWSTQKIKNEGYNLDFVKSPSGWKVFTKVRDIDSAALKDIVMDITTNAGSADIKRAGLKPQWFDYPKPIDLIRLLSEVSTSENDITLDFFAGSGTTAHAVMELNAEDGGNRQSISVQLPEILEENSEAYKAGYRTIADITRARIDKVIDKLKAENPETTEDLACAHFTLAPSNFKVWQSDLRTAEEIQAQLELHQRLEKSEATDDEISQNAMLAELLLKNGLGALGVHAISKPKTLSNGLTVHRVLMEDDRQLWVCFEPYQDGLKDEIAKAQPAQVILLNSCFTGPKADEQISNLQLELQNFGIDLVII